MEQMNLMNSAINRLVSQIMNGKEHLLKERIEALNMPWDTGFLKEHVSCVMQIGDPYEHYWFNYGKPDAIRLLSIENNPEMPEIFSEDFSYKVKAEYKYY